MAYPVEIWAKLRAEYELGAISIRGLEKKYSIARKTIENRIKKEGWVKAESTTKVRQMIEKSTAEKFIAKGMPSDRVVGLVVDGMTEPDILKFEGPEGNQICTPVVDYDQRRKYIDMHLKMVGGYAAEKKEVTGKILNININLSKEELMDKLRRIEGEG